MVQKGGEDGSPPWLRALLRTSFFVPCGVHGVSSKSECNMYCLWCMGAALCPSCLPRHKDHYVVQIRRSSYHSAIMVSELSKLFDLSLVQTYAINGGKAVFLNERPQSTAGKKERNNACHCQTCRRSLVESFRFCSLGCKLGAMKPEPKQLTFIHHSLGGLDSDGQQSGPRKRMRMTSTADFSQKDRHASHDDETPPTTRSSKSRRKGVPRRAPFF